MEMGRNVARLLAAAMLAAGCSAGLWSGGDARAQTVTDTAADESFSPVVVELFTSQGCSSCPPADELLRDLSGHEGVIALALHVDYWDYIGWKDSFARPEHTARQKAYARASGERMIYTPQIIVEGETRVAGAKAMALFEAIEAKRHASRQVALRVERTGSALLVEARALARIPAGLVVQLVRYQPEGRVEILRGENAGRSFTYANIVTAWDTVAEWDGDAPLNLRLDAPGDAPAVVIVQETGHGPILASAQVR
jgi:hypothetical protein